MVPSLHGGGAESTALPLAPGLTWVHPPPPALLLQETSSTLAGLVFD